MNSIYTFIMEFRGGTYTSQVTSDTLEASIKDWIDIIEEERHEIYQLGLKTIEEIRNQLLCNDLDHQPVLLNGLVNVWFFTISPQKGFGIIHIIKTVSE